MKPFDLKKQKKQMQKFYYQKENNNDVEILLLFCGDLVKGHNRKLKANFKVNIYPGKPIVVSIKTKRYNNNNNIQQRDIQT